MNEKKVVAWLVIVLGVLLILPLAGVTQLGSLTNGVLAWLIALGVLLTGIVELMKVSK
tara:strand:+ start:13964 stop:14137 length:174 start_codon:yes stop_codon:yes gene_type:complete